MMPRIGIIDYGMGNLGSVLNACRFIGAQAEIVCEPAGLTSCRAVILPGVGAFGDCMTQLVERGFAGPLRDWIAAGRPFLGICLGLQVLFDSSEESPGVAGLGVFPGEVKRFCFANAPSDGALMKVPQIGWNAVRQTHAGDPIFRGVPSEEYFYFVHSYYVAPRDGTLTAGVTGYGLEYCSAVASGAVAAVQFHPEKSQNAGLQILRNFAKG